MQKAAANDKERSRRYIYLKDVNYADVAKAASMEKVDKGAIIDKALEMYFKADQKN